MTEQRQRVGTPRRGSKPLAVIGVCLTLIVGGPLLPESGHAQSKQESGAASESDEELSAAEKKKFQQLVKKGKKAFSVDEYEKALDFFERAYEIKQTPNLLFNMGLVSEQAGELEKALERYEKFVVSPGVTLELRKKAQERIDALRPIVEDQKSDEEEKAEEEKGSAPDKLADSETEGPVDETDEGESGGGQSSSSLAGPIALVGGGVAAIGGGVVFTLLSESAAKKVQSSPTPQARRDAQAAAFRNQWIADGLFVGGLGLGTAGAILWANAVSGGTGGGSGSASVVPTLGPGFAGMRLETRF